jgi:hypothetical protein
LLDKLTGKLPAELKGGSGQLLPPINFNKDTPKKGGPKSKMSTSTKSRAGDDEKEVKFALGTTGED